jgi:eukaryotic-like serine/threonine-protein kinase
MMEHAEGEPVTTQEGPAPLGDLIGKRWTTQYRIVGLIGCGGMGEVWVAASEDIPDQRLAVKVISPEHAHLHEVVERFFGEARAASALNDPNVVKIYDTGRLEDGRPVLVMEFVDGPSLQALIDTRPPLSIDAIGQIMIQTASALHAAHAKNIVHRDIKPSNLLVTPRWGRAMFLVVVDFGIAKLGDPQLAGKIRTRTKTFIGTPGFVAPEQALGKPIDAKADLYALGVVLYYTLTGRLPYDADSELATLNLQITGAPFRPPIELRPDTPPAWNALVLDCLQLDRARRPNAIEFACRIASALPNGELLLQMLAPSIAVRRGPSAANAPTLSSDVPTALAQLGASHALSRAVARGRAARLVLVAAAAGAVLGSVATVLAMRLTSPTAPEPLRDEPRIGQPAPDAAPDAAPDGVAQLDAAPIDTARLAPPAIDAAAPAADAAVPVADAGAPPAVTKPPGPATIKGVRPGKGRVLVSVTPFADVYIDGRAVGTTPIDITLSAGPHTVRLVNQPRGQDQTVSITVDPSKPVILEKNW